MTQLQAHDVVEVFIIGKGAGADLVLHPLPALRTMRARTTYWSATNSCMVTGVAQQSAGRPKAPYPKGTPMKTYASVTNPIEPFRTPFAGPSA